MKTINLTDDEAEHLMLLVNLANMIIVNDTTRMGRIVNLLMDSNIQLDQIELDLTLHKQGICNCTPTAVQDREAELLRFKAYLKTNGLES